MMRWISWEWLFGWVGRFSSMVGGVSGSVNADSSSRYCFFIMVQLFDSQKNIEIINYLITLCITTLFCLLHHYINTFDSITTPLWILRLILIYINIRMSVQAIVPLQFNGQQFYTHTSWFSEKQYNAWTSIPVQNHNLSLYYGLSTIGVFAIFFRKSAVIRSFFTSYGKVVTGLGGTAVGSYLGWLAFLKTQEGGEIQRVVLKNQCGSTPLWKKEDSVVNLREKDYKTFMSRRDGRKYNAGDVKGYNPDSVLLGSQSSPTLQKLV